MRPVLLLLLAALAAPVLASDPVVAVVRLEGQKPGWGLESLLTVSAGSVPDPLEVRRSVQNLYDTGRLQQVEVLEEEAPEGVVLLFRVIPHPEVRKVRMECDGCPRPPTVLPGTPCTPELREKVRGAVSEALIRKGYLHPEVEADCREGALVLSGGRGARSRITGVSVLGEESAAASEKLSRLVGEPYRRDRIAARVAAVEKKLRKTASQARLRLLPYEEVPGGLLLRVEAAGLTPVRFAPGGDATAKDAQRVRKALFGEPLSDEILAQRADDLADGYRAMGHAQARAAITVGEAEPGRRVLVDLTLGPRFLLSAVRLSGTGTVAEADLLALLPPAGDRPYDPEEAREWQGVLLDGLLARGYLDAVVRGPDARLDAAAGAAELSFRIDEGPCYVPDTVDVLGLPDPLEPPPLRVRAGEPLSPDRVQGDLESLQSLLDSAGYGGATIGVQKEANRLAYAVTPGPRTVVDRLLFRGLWATRPGRVWPEVTLRAGSPLGFDKVLETQSRLYGTGLFSSVEVSPRTEPEDPSRATVVLNVEEDAPRSYTYGIGYDTYDGVRVQGGLYHNNLFGTRRAVGLEGRYSGREEQWRLFYREPTFFFIPLPIQVVIFQSQEQRPDFSLDRWGTTAEFVRTLGSRTRTIFRYAYEIQDAHDITTGYPVPREDADKNVSSLGVGYIHDGRDDPFYPTRGRFFTMDLRYAFPLMNATSRFLKADARQAFYTSPFAGSTVAFSARLGVIRNRLADEEVPLGERFFLGGRDTVRAFSRDAVGVEGQTVVDGSPIGGNAFALFNLEWRQRLRSWLGVSFFLDAGQVWAEWRDLEKGDLRRGSGYGAGLFLFSPLGLIRAEYSRKFEEASWDDRGQWYFSIGVPF